jgi:hypothetical protein
MSSAHIRSMIYLALAFTSRIATGQIEIYSLPAPENQQNTVEEIPSPEATSLMTGIPVVPIPLDDTGVADWRYINPRKPQRVRDRFSIEFVNLTADRTFEVTTNVSLRPAELVPQPFPATVPLVIYDALMLESVNQERPPFRTDERETLRAYEIRLIQEAKDEHPTYATILDDVLQLEEALRERTANVAAESAARSHLLGLKLETEAAAVNPAEVALRKAIANRSAADDRVRELTGVATPSTDDDLAERRKPLIDAITAKATSWRQRRGRSATPEERLNYNGVIASLDAAIDALKTQSTETSLLVQLRRSIPSIRLDDCTVEVSVTCTAAIQVYPNGSGVFPHEVLLFQTDPTGPARFNVRFFEEEETPARQVAYLLAERLAGRTGPPKSIGTLAAVASIGASTDPFIEDRSTTSRNCPFLCVDKPYNGAQRTHYVGSGRIEVTQTFGNLLDGKVNIAFKDGDLGGSNSTTDIKLSQYRFNIYSEPGWTFHYGKFQFAAPSSGIAISESGEGFRLAFHNYAVSHIIKRESSANIADAANLDNRTWIAEANNMAIPNWILKKFPRQPLRTLNLIYLHGNDRKGMEQKKNPNTNIEETSFTGHEYQTYGAQIGITVPRLFYGTVSGYRSRRDAKEKEAPCGNALHVCDGRGDVGLLTITRPFSVDEDGKSKRTITFTLGIGSGDDPASTTEDEGYIGESAGYTPDQIFLSTLSGGISTRNFFDVKQFADPTNPDNDRLLKENFHTLDLGVVGIGRGLANKRYLGLKYVDNSFSLLEVLATTFLPIPQSDIRSRATVITLNDYRLRRPPLNSRSHHAGYELDIEFLVETPRAVKVALRGGYYWRGAAVEQFILKDAWTVSTGISISL